MYFATLLFWVTGIVAVIISLATQPGEDYMVMKTISFVEMFEKGRITQHYKTFLCDFIFIGLDYQDNLGKIEE